MRPVHDVVGGPEVQPGVAVELVPGVARLTAPNPGMMTGPGTNTYLVGSSELAVIDPGPADEPHLDAIVAAAADRGSVVRWILVTHTHPDHAPGAAGLATRTGATVIGFDGRDGFSPDQAAGDGWTLRGPDFVLRAVHTPGHASNHLCWLVEEPALLLSGDHVMQGSTVVIRPPDGNMATYLANLRRLLVLQPAIALIGPGHGRMIVDPAAVVNDTVAHRLERERVVLTALVSLRYGTVDDLVGTVYADVNDERKKVARHSLLAHLLKLADDGQVRMLDPGPMTPSADTPSADTPSADTPSADTPSADTPSADTPSAAADDDQVKEPRLLAVWEAVGRPGL
jgi:glyoxylase-like metal-dependent hydrolase (beta-lactamase superfamily II)